MGKEVFVDEMNASLSYIFNPLCSGVSKSQSKASRARSITKSVAGPETNIERHKANAKARPARRLTSAAALKEKLRHSEFTAVVRVVNSGIESSGEKSRKSIYQIASRFGMDEAKEKTSREWVALLLRGQQNYSLLPSPLRVRFRVSKCVSHVPLFFMLALKCLVSAPYRRASRSRSRQAFSEAISFLIFVERSSSIISRLVE